MESHTVLLVDDEPNILRSLIRLLRRDAYTILSAGSGAEGLDVLAENPVDVVISDQRMPGMTGTEFLSQVKELYPDTVRIVLSGYTDLDSVTDAINQGAIYKFLTKPWDDELLRQNVREAFEKHELRAENLRLEEELRLANKALSRKVVEQGRELNIHSRILEISRDVLEHLPVGVLGVGDDGFIAVANSMAHRMLGLEDAEIIGQDAHQVLPARLIEVCEAEGKSELEKPRNVELEGMGSMKMYCSSLGKGNHGKILVFLPK